MPTGSVLLKNEKNINSKGYVTAPAKGVYPGILLLHQEYGLDAAVRATAENLAAHGHIVFVPNLFWRKMNACELNSNNRDDKIMSKKLINEYNFDDGFSDITACLKWLRETPQCNGLTATIGTGFSANLSYMAGNWLDIEASVCYGLNSLAFKKKSNDVIRRPMLIHMGELFSNEGKINNDMLENLKNTLNIHYYSYAECENDFSRIGDIAYNEKASNEANSRTLTHLKNSFKKPYNT